MIKYVVGPSGSGKTKWLIDRANDDKENGLGNIVFIDTDDSHIYSLSHKVRLINAKDYHIVNNERLFGFLSGILSRDYDIEKIYIDGIYEIVDFNENSLEELSEELKVLAEQSEVQLYIGMNCELNELPEEFKDNAVELEG